MAKKILENEKNISKDKDTDANFYKMKQFNSDVCKLKHVSIDKEFKNIENNDNKRHEELIAMIQNIREDIKKDVGDIQKNIKEDVKSNNDSIKEDVKSNCDNLKDKIILTEKIIGEKIDNLSEFDDTLKGNGHPGIWESIRNLKWKFRITITMFIIMFILVVGGDFRGVTISKIKDVIGIGKQIENKQIENKQIENKQIENKQIENKQIENKQIENKQVENKQVENKQ